MLSPSRKQLVLSAVASLTAFAMLLLPASGINAADHRDGPIFSHTNITLDVDDVYLFLDPNDPAMVVMAFDVAAPIIPPENVSAGFFDPRAVFRFQVENTGDSAGDIFIDVAFTMQAGPGLPQTAAVTLSTAQSGLTSKDQRLSASRGYTFTAPTTVPSITATNAPDPVITTDERTGISFAAGLFDDPFFFNLTGEYRYRQSRIAGSPDPTVFAGGYDSFAGYNTMLIALRVPAALLRGPAGNTIGLAAFTQLNAKASAEPGEWAQNTGQFTPVDRMGIPGINTMLIPFARKDEYNLASTVDDAQGKFADDIVTTLRQLQTDDTSINIITQLAVRKGDMLRLDFSIPNTGPGGGTNPAAAFPNGRRPGDDVADRLITLINNRVAQGDNVNANDVPFRDSFPFFAPPTQP